MKKEKITTVVKLGEDTAVAQLSIKDQIKFMLNPKEKYEVDAELEDLLRRKANLTHFLENAVRNRSEVVISLSSKFEDILEDVLNNLNYYEYFDIQIDKPLLRYEIDYFFTVTLKEK